MNFADGNGFLEVIIYVVIMLAGLAGSIYRNYLKRKEAEKRKEQGELYTDFPEIETEPEFDEGVFGEEPEFEEKLSTAQAQSDSPVITGTNQPEVPEPIEHTIRKESLLDRPVSEVESGVPLDTAEVIPQESASEDLLKRSEETADSIFGSDLLMDEIHEPFPDKEILEEFDAKKAIIYAEIINGKYI